MAAFSSKSQIFPYGMFPDPATQQADVYRQVAPGFVDSPIVNQFLPTPPPPMPGDPNFRGPMSPPIEEIEVTAQKRQPGFFPSRIGRSMARGGGFQMTDAQKRGVYTPAEQAQFRADRNQGIGKMLLGLSDAFAGRPIAENFMAREEYAKQQELRNKKLAEQQRIREAIMNDPNIPQSQKEMLAAFPEKYLEIITRAPKERKTANIDGVLRYIDTGEQVYPGDKGDSRKIIKGGDDYNYYLNEDGTTERVLPGVTIPESQTDNRTANQKNYDAYSKIMAEGDEQQKEIAGKIFISGTNQLKTKEQFLIAVAQSASSKEFADPSDIKATVDAAADLYDEIIGSKENTFLPQGFQGSAEQWQELKKANPNGNDQELIAWF